MRNKLYKAKLWGAYLERENKNSSHTIKRIDIHCHIRMFRYTTASITHLHVLT